MKSTGSTTGTHGKRGSVMSPIKRALQKAGSMSPDPKPGVQEPPKLSRVVEMMMDKICPTNIAASEGLGTDNMTCMIVEFNKPSVLE
jgi:hypothetical protein